MDALFETDEKYAELAATLAAQGVEYAFFSLIDLTEKGLDGHWEEERQYEPVHAIRSQAGSLASGILSSVDRVNSIHHQANADPGQMLRATAWSPDGLVEAVEGRELLGVQWHPERLTATDPRHLAPFEWVVLG